MLLSAEITGHFMQLLPLDQTGPRPKTPATEIASLHAQQIFTQDFPQRFALRPLIPFRLFPADTLLGCFRGFPQPQQILYFSEALPVCDCDLTPVAVASAVVLYRLLTHHLVAKNVPVFPGLLLLLPFLGFN